MAYSTTDTAIDNISTGQTLLGEITATGIGVPGATQSYAINLVAGVAYTFRTQTSGTNSSLTLADTTLGLYDSDGTRLAYNDDYSGLSSQINFTAVSSGTYYLQVEDYNNNNTGTFNIIVDTPLNSAPILTGSQVTLTAANAGTTYFISNTSLLQGWNDADQDTLSVTNLTNSANYTVQPAQDGWNVTVPTNGSGTINLNYTISDGSGGHLVSAQNFLNITPSQNNLTPSINISSVDATTSEDGGTGIISVSLGAAPSGAGISITLTSSDTTEGGFLNAGNISATKVLTFTAANWQTPQLATITGVQDYDADGDQPYTITARATQADLVNPATNYTNTILNNFNARGPINFVNYADLTSTGKDKDSPVTLIGDNGGPVEDDIRGNDGPDRIYTGYMDDTLHGGIGDDRLYGSYGDDYLFGDEGNDRLYGEQDDDYLNGGAGNDILDGGIGADTLIGGTGNDTYYLTLDENGNLEDTIVEATGIAGGALDSVYIPYSVENFSLTGQFAGIERAVMNAGNINSNLAGNASNNTLVGNAGNNVLTSGAGNDVCNGGSGNDTLSGDAGNDTLSGGTGNDSITGGIGSDVVNGGDGADIENGGDGSDIISGGSGNDQLTGGLGADFFVFNSALSANSNRDTILDYNLADDTIRLENSFMTGLGLTVGVLSPAMFHRGTVNIATEADDRIVYNMSTGALFYDADGTGSSAPIQIALIGTTTHAALSNTDFVVI